MYLSTEKLKKPATYNLIFRFVPIVFQLLMFWLELRQMVAIFPVIFSKRVPFSLNFALHSLQIKSLSLLLKLFHKKMYFNRISAK